MMERLWDVPISWEWAVVKELGDVVLGGTPSTKMPEYWGGDVIWFAPSDLTGYKSKFIAQGQKTLTDEGLAKSSAKVMPAGSIMFSSRAPIGYVAINSMPSATNQGFKSIVPHSDLFNEYIYYYLKATKHIAEARATGTTFKELSGSAFGALPIPISPPSEQRRIVEKIEALFEEIDRGVESLRAAKSALDLYRKSLLKSAFEGRLTAEWRARNPDKLESPEALLARIRTKKKSGKTRKSGNSPAMTDQGTTERLWDVPTSWEWAVIKELGDVVSGGTPSTKIPEYWGGDVIWFAPSDLTGYKSKFIARGQKTLTDEGLAKSSAKVMPAGSIMFSSRAPIGYVAINSMPSATNQGFKSIVPHSDLFNEYIYYYLKATKHIAEARATGTTFKELSGSAFGALPIPISPPNEQRRIVEILDARLEAADKLEAETDAALARADTLRQSILKKAFAGQLVPQDPADEPASALLDRIKAERAAQSKRPLRKPRKRKVAAA